MSMQIALSNPIRKAAFLAICCLAASAYVVLITTGFFAAYFSGKFDLFPLHTATELAPGDAEYKDRLARYFLVAQDAATAVPLLQSAVALNPHAAGYWLDLSAAYRRLGQNDLSLSALERAIEADPRNTQVAWQAANVYWASGDKTRALKEFGQAMEGDHGLLVAVLKRCWQIDPDADWLLRGTVPSSAEAYSAFLELVIADEHKAAAQQIWSAIVQLKQPVERRYVFEYVHFLIEQREVEQAASVWRQAASLSDLSAYEAKPENLVVNADFDLPILNAGFDWMYEKSPGVTITLDRAESHSGHRSLSIAFDSSGLEDAGIRQYIPLEANAKYSFSAYFKAQNLEGVGGPRLIIQDAFSGAPYFQGDQIKQTDSWQEIAGIFATLPHTRLVILRIQRFPPGKAIRGTLWIDDVRLTKEESDRD